MTASMSVSVPAVRRAVGLAALTAWLGAALPGGSSPDDLADAAARVGLRRIRRDGAVEPLVLAVAALRSEGFARARLVLPAPADPLGLPGPAELNRRAIDAGAAILLLPGTGTEPQPPDRAAVLLPCPDDEDWPLRVVPLGPAAASSWPTFTMARSDFGRAVHGHSQALDDLDVAADARGLRGVVEDEDCLPLPPLPPALAGERRDLLARARLVAVLAAAAIADDGRSVSAAEATSRAAHLRALASVARRAIAASVSG
jgi:hypothetical protein